MKQKASLPQPQIPPPTFELVPQCAVMKIALCKSFRDLQMVLIMWLGKPPSSQGTISR